ncbi:hypothetical protein D3C87_1822890 [compost metagenome]
MITQAIIVIPSQFLLQQGLNRGALVTMPESGHVAIYHDGNRCGYRTEVSSEIGHV